MEQSDADKKMLADLKEMKLITPDEAISWETKATSDQRKELYAERMAAAAADAKMLDELKEKTLVTPEEIEAWKSKTSEQRKAIYSEKTKK